MLQKKKIDYVVDIQPNPELNANLQKRVPDTHPHPQQAQHMIHGYPVLPGRHVGDSRTFQERLASDCDGFAAPVNTPASLATPMAPHGNMPMPAPGGVGRQLLAQHGVDGAGAGQNDPYTIAGQIRMQAGRDIEAGARGAPGAVPGPGLRHAHVNYAH